MTTKYEPHYVTGGGPRTVADLETGPYRMGHEEISLFIEWLHEHPDWHWANEPYVDTAGRADIGGGYPDLYLGGCLGSPSGYSPVKRDFDGIVHQFRKEREAMSVPTDHG
jgi:hypothetical protein